jgi:cytoskeletal protein CcmA (bactofilin family)
MIFCLENAANNNITVLLRDIFAYDLNIIRRCAIMFKSFSASADPAKDKNKNKDEASTVIGKGTKIEAAMLTGSGVIRIEGEYCGEAQIDGDLILTRSGHINGNISVNGAYISGSVTGNVKCGDILHITSTGKISGDIECDAVLMDEGAVFIGYSKMSERERDDPLGLDE